MVFPKMPALEYVDAQRSVNGATRRGLRLQQVPAGLKRLARLVRAILFLVLVPNLVQAQATMTSFDDVANVLKADDIVLVVTKTGKETKGMVATTSPSSLTLDSGQGSG